MKKEIAFSTWVSQRTLWGSQVINLSQTSCNTISSLQISLISKHLQILSLANLPENSTQPQYYKRIVLLSSSHSPSTLCHPSDFSSSSFLLQGRILSYDLESCLSLSLFPHFFQPKEPGGDWTGKDSILFNVMVEEGGDKSWKHHILKKKKSHPHTHMLFPLPRMLDFILPCSVFYHLKCSFSKTILFTPLSVSHQVAAWLP